MKTIDQNFLIEELIKQTQNHIAVAESLLELPEEALNYRSRPETWSILECIEHLNLYAEFYHPEFHALVEKNENKKGNGLFKPGYWGNKFAKSMLPGESRPMRSPRDKDPIYSKLYPKIINGFIAHQNQLIKLLERSKNIPLDKIKCPLSLSQFVKLRLGDVYRVVIFHNTRHLSQAKNIAENLELVAQQ
ncbi:DinB family protein [Luteibaculum oceani]|uniref:DinB family protein n=1 Tax=Luteibaculum oceani TaxID=1294296 RepID=A0A5C6V9D5_9FLAO|nr:DinB family protein [Luteibaculum oceani]TXC82083.1 DinB family protein [Luteibaculum oceani]